MRARVLAAFQAKLKGVGPKGVGSTSSENGAFMYTYIYIYMENLLKTYGFQCYVYDYVCIFLQKG